MLPALNAAEAAHSAALLQHISQRIEAAGGFIDFADLHGPGAVCARVWGTTAPAAPSSAPAGDFTTAPEVSSLFARCVARQCAQVLREIPGGSILELGAGTGSMAATMLEELAELQALPVAL